MRVWGMYQLPDRTGYRNARLGGFTNVSSAVKAIAKRGGVGFIMDQHRSVQYAVRHGRIINLG